MQNVKKSAILQIQLILSGFNQKEMKVMQTQTVEIATIVNNGIVERIGRSTTYHPPIIEQKREMQWFDDNKLIKANKK